FVELPLAIELQGGWSHSGAGDLAIDWTDLALRLPLARSGALDVESTGTEPLHTRLRTDSVGLEGAAGPLLWNAGYQRLHANFVAGPGHPRALGQAHLLARGCQH